MVQPEVRRHPDVRVASLPSEPHRVLRGDVPIVGAELERDRRPLPVPLGVQRRVERGAQRLGAGVRLTLWQQPVGIVEQRHPWPRPVGGRADGGDANDPEIHPGHGDSDIATHRHPAGHHLRRETEFGESPVDDRESVE